MASNSANVQSISQASLGNLVKIYPLRHRAWQRWGNLLIGLLLLAVGAATLIWGGVVLYQQYYQHGPAILVKTILPYASAGGAAFLLAIILLITAGLRWNREIVLYADGMVIRQRHVNVIRWGQVEETRIGRIQSLFLGVPTRLKQWVALDGGVGKPVVIRDDFAEMEELVHVVRETITAHRYPQAAADFAAGNSLDFGPLVINRNQGISQGATSISWAEIHLVEIKSGKMVVQINPTDGQRKNMQIPISELPNLDILVRLLAQQVDVRFD